MLARKVFVVGSEVLTNMNSTSSWSNCRVVSLSAYVHDTSCRSRNCSAPSEWFATYCPSSLSWLPVVGLCLYLLFFAPGMGPLPWTINTELYPTWCRASCAGIATAVNWGSNLLVSISFLTILDLLGKLIEIVLICSYCCCTVLAYVVFVYRKTWCVRPLRHARATWSSTLLFQAPRDQGTEPGRD